MFYVECNLVRARAEICDIFIFRKISYTLELLLLDSWNVREQKKFRFKSRPRTFMQFSSLCYRFRRSMYVYRQKEMFQFFPSRSLLFMLSRVKVINSSSLSLSPFHFHIAL